MGNLFTSLLTSTQTLGVYQRGLDVVQNNVANASTPGFAKQTLTVTAKQFDVDRGIVGGVQTGQVVSSRDKYAEAGVWRQQERSGRTAQTVRDLSRMEPLLDATGRTGVPAALDRFFQSAQQLSVNPNDTATRRVVLERADQLAASVRQTANGLNASVAATDRQLTSTVADINRVGARIRDLNEQRRQSFRNTSDPSLEAGLYNALEELAGLVSFSAVMQPDGSATVLLAGQSPLVFGDQQYEVQLDLTQTDARLLNAQGEDLTDRLPAGRISSLLDQRNNLLPELTAGLDQIAQTVADEVNAVLQSGLDANGEPPAMPLFSYDATQGVALTLAVNPLAPSQVAAALGTAPGGNGNALELAAFSQRRTIGGATFAEAYGNLAARVGRELRTAKDDHVTHQQLLIQARSLRQDASGVSLDEQAARLLEYQKAYQATAKLFTVLNELTDTVLGLLR